ncbi:MAG: hypothetical protein RLZZ312_908 [Bacteroidota bacterium]|jgi:hypothetical protein
MTKFIFYLTKCIVIAITLFLLASCKSSIEWGDGRKGSGTVTTQNRIANEAFSKIKVQQGIIVELSQNDSQSIAVTADDNIQDLIETKIENGTLTISAKESYNSTTSPRVAVSTKIIAALTASSGSEIKSFGQLSSTKLDVKSSSGSTIKIDVEADDLSLDSSSGSTINAAGKALKLETSASSGSSINAKKLLANDVFAQASSGSSTNISPIVSLEGKASSGSSVNYHQAPKIIKIEESSGGSVSAK